ncbi:MAG: NAD(P)-binding domain-containing protein, partial [Pyrinomonadaceae bacterium]|nr:NAD(P)-binding domain-containing protein [Sphingobacteriaceae bacterium]
MKVVLLGSGNVATHLGKALQAAGHEIAQVWSPTLAHAEVLGDLLNTDFTDQLLLINANADIYILSVTDQAIADTAAKFPHKGKVLVHTSGTTEIKIPAITGVFYPLQTFSRQREIDFTIVPILIEARDLQTKNVLINLGESISKIVKQLDSDQRRA